MKIIESPREGMQNLHFTIPTVKKLSYIQQILKVGFDTVEVGSIVSPKLIPQMADTMEILKQIDFSGIRSNRMVLVVNKKGAELISEVKDLCQKTGKQLVIYISMAFGNPYGDPWSTEILAESISVLKKIGVRVIPLSNVAIEIDDDLIRKIFSTLIPEFPSTEFGLHLHTTNKNWKENVIAAYEKGCRRFDSVMNGFGGCPMTGKEMLGNLKTENLVAFAGEYRLSVNLDRNALTKTLELVSPTFMEPVSFSNHSSNIQ